MSENSNSYEELIIRFLDGHASTEEVEQLEKWKASSKANQLEFEQIEALFLLSADVELFNEIDVEADLKSVKSRLPHQKQEGKVRSVSTRLMRIAAVIVCLVGATFLFYFMSTEEKPQYIALSDGTKVYLRDQATLDFPKTFDTDQRRVTLHGEAFFEVAHDATKPFIIVTANTEVKVLGTTFLVSEQKNKVDVVVKTGKVQFSVKEEKTRHVILTANEQGIYANHEIKEQVNQNKNYLSWHTGAFEFTDTDIDMALSELSTFYPEMKLGHRVVSDCPLTASFDDESVQTIIQTIEATCSLRAQEVDGVWVFQ